MDLNGYKCITDNKPLRRLVSGIKYPFVETQMLSLILNYTRYFIEIKEQVKVSRKLWYTTKNCMVVSQVLMEWGWVCPLLCEPLSLTWSSLTEGEQLLMVETRQGKKTMPCVKPEELTAKTNGSHISTKTNEILKLFMAMFSTFQINRDNKIKDLDKKSRHSKTQPQHWKNKFLISRNQWTTKCPFSVMKYPLLKPKS